MTPGHSSASDLHNQLLQISGLKMGHSEVGGNFVVSVHLLEVGDKYDI